MSQVVGLCENCITLKPSLLKCSIVDNMFGSLLYLDHINCQFFIYEEKNIMRGAYVFILVIYCCDIIYLGLYNTNHMHDMLNKDEGLLLSEPWVNYTTRS